MYGVRGLYNFGWQEEGEIKKDAKGGRRVDEEEMMEGGLRGRFSAGGEVYFSARQRSFGGESTHQQTPISKYHSQVKADGLSAVSTGLRFTTLPPLPPVPGSPPPSPPTTLTLLYNPLIGFISSAYSAQVSPTVALSSRFGVNIYSYESDLSIGGEWWIGRRRGKKDLGQQQVGQVVVAQEPIRLYTGPSLRGEGEGEGKGVEDAKVERELDSPFPITRLPLEDVQIERQLDSPFPITTLYPLPASSSSSSGELDRDGVLKARLSGNWASQTIVSFPIIPPSDGKRIL